MRLWPATLVGRTVLVVLIGVIMSNVVALTVFLGERRELLTTTRGRWLADRVAAVAEALEETPPGERRRMSRSMRGASLRLFWSPTPYLAADEAAGRGNGVRGLLLDELDFDDDDRLRLAYRSVGDLEAPFLPPPGRRGRRAAGRGPSSGDVDGADRGDDLRLLVGSLALTDGSWLNFATPYALAPPFWAWRLLLLVMATTLVALAASAWAVRRAAKPLSQLAAAADRLGVDVDAPPLAEDGPREVRVAARAFNDMQRRLAAFVRDRTQVLAAISHDLRTPLTRLRLRAELIDDDEQRAKLRADLDEMEAMIAASLAYARDDAARERAQSLDLAAVLQTLCEERADGGAEVLYLGPPHLVVTGRALALRRAFANLIDNAIAYGGGARVDLAGEADGVIVTVDDDGPGLPEAELERVFEPFYRVETSRCRDTGGFGLGLAVVRSAARTHGGEATLANRPGGGLRATVRLPRAAA
jgi:signal transduction histidine kinase